MAETISLQDKLDYLDKTPWLSDAEKETLKNLFKTMNVNSQGAKEWKETMTKSLEFAEDTFRIESKDWEEVTDKDTNNEFLAKFVWKWVRVKANDSWNVVECLEDCIIGDQKCNKGEQLFIDYDIFIDYVAKDKGCSIQEAEARYMMTIKELKEKMKDKPSGSEAYKKFQAEEINGHNAGCWNPLVKKFYGVGERSYIWLVGGVSAGFNQNDRYCYTDYREFGFSGRLLKN